MSDSRSPHHEYVSPAHAEADTLRSTQRHAAAQYTRTHATWTGQVPEAVGTRANIARAIDALLKPIQERMRAGCDSDAVAALVAQWSLPFSEHVRPSSIGAKGKRHQDTLIIHCDHAVYRQELRPRLPALRAALAPLGIAEVLLR